MIGCNRFNFVFLFLQAILAGEADSVVCALC